MSQDRWFGSRTWNLSGDKLLLNKTEGYTIKLLQLRQL